MKTEGKDLQARLLVESLRAEEREYLIAVVQGRSHAAIRLHLGLSEFEGAAVRRSLMRKFEARMTADLVRIGIYAGLA